MSEVDIEKKYCSFSLQIYIIRLTPNQQRYKLKFYDELKSEMESIAQQMVEAKKNYCANALKEEKLFCNEIRFTSWTLKSSLSEGRKQK